MGQEAGSPSVLLCQPLGRCTYGVAVLSDCTARERMVVKKEQVYQKAFVKRERGGEGQLDDVLV